MNHLLIVGLGNPGERYKGNRHNIGFMIIDAFTKKIESSWKDSKKYDESSQNIDGFKIHFIKPKEYMNLSGISVASFSKSFKIPPNQILVIQDEVDLPFGKIKNKIGGGTAGHNGLRDIVDRMGSGDFHRLRFGVGKPDKEQMEVADFVLQNFTSDEKGNLAVLLVECVKRIEEWILNSATQIKKSNG